MKRKFKSTFTKVLMMCALTTTAVSCSKEETVQEIPVLLKKEKVMLGDSDYNSTVDPGVSDFHFRNSEYKNNNFLIPTISKNESLKLFPHYTFTRPYKPFSSVLEEVDMEVQLVLVTNNVEENIGDKIVVKTGAFGNNGSVNTNDISMRGLVGEPTVQVSKLLRGELYLKYRYKDYRNNVWVENKKTTKRIGASLVEVNPFSFAYRPVRVPYVSPPSIGSENVLYRNASAPVLNVDQAIYSVNRQYFFILQSDGNLVLYTADWKVLWTADTNGKGGKYLFFAPDGNLVLAKNLDASGVVWASNIYTSMAIDNAGPKRLFYILQDDGNLVFYWDGGTYTESMGDTGTSGGRKSSHFGRIM